MSSLLLPLQILSLSLSLFFRDTRDKLHLSCSPRFAFTHETREERWESREHYILGTFALHLSASLSLSDALSDISSISFIPFVPADSCTSFLPSSSDQTKRAMWEPVKKRERKSSKKTSWLNWLTHSHCHCFYCACCALLSSLAWVFIDVSLYLHRIASLRPSPFASPRSGLFTCSPRVFALLPEECNELIRMNNQSVCCLLPFL